jgi:amidophosphoribosyltransferase
MDIDEDLLHEECGVFGISDYEDGATLVALGLHALQHRGQEATGIVSFDGTMFHSEKKLGLVGDNFSNKDVMKRLAGNSAIGHVRYSTTGETVLRNVQPLFAELSTGGLSVCHNGNFTNSLYLRKKLIKNGAIFQSTSDTEVILHLLAKSDKSCVAERFVDAILQLEGGYALVAMTDKKIIGARDPNGIRPLVLGKLEGSYVLASETCAFDIIGAKFEREIKSGEVVIIENGVLTSFFPFSETKEKPCVFEYIYFARPDSIMGGKSVYDIRKNFGKQLALESPVDADMVIPIPDSGVPSAIGYSMESGIDFELGIIRNHYVGRTFIEPSQQIRELGVRMKHSACSIVRGKRIILIDDSIVRGSTSRKIAQMMYNAGAKEVHMRIASPPIKYPDYYGIDTPNRDKLLAANYSIEDMRELLSLTSLGFLSVSGLYKSIGFENGRDNDNPQLTDHCFTGDYPTKLVDFDMVGGKLGQLSLLRESL